LVLAIVLGVILAASPVSRDGLWPGLAFLAFLQVSALVLNLIPLPPFDGFGIVQPFLPEGIQKAVAQVSGLIPWAVFFLLWYVPEVYNTFWAAVVGLTDVLNVPLDLVQLGLRTSGSGTDRHASGARPRSYENQQRERSLLSRSPVHNTEGFGVEHAEAYAAARRHRGRGFGGLQTARRLAKAPVRVTLIDRENYHLFQPLLYQVAIAGLVPSQIAYPVRTIFRRQKNVTFQMGEVTAVDFDARYVKTDGSVLAYDYLVLAVGGRTNFFGLRSVEENAYQVKNIQCAISTRNQLLKMFEQASHEVDTAKRRAMLTFVVVGGGPTGVETAGALAELIRLVMAKDYPQMDLGEVRVLLLEDADQLMGAYPPRLSQATYDLLKKKQVEIRLSTRLTDYDGQSLTLGDGSMIETKTVIWTAGVRRRSGVTAWE
jgi:thioredoxin reductase